MATTEVRVVRPLKVIALTCVAISFFLLFICIVTPYWLESGEFHQGLWKLCEDSSDCTSTANRVWVTACAVACVISLVTALVAFVFILLCLLSKNLPKKYAFYIAALVFIFFAMVCLLAALVVFPVMFMKTIVDYRNDFKKTDWFFSWSYGVCWGSWLFLVGAAILLLIERVGDDTIQKEKAFYETNM